MKVLVTGFEPFGGDTVNPSWEAVKLLPDQIGGADIIGLQVPVEYGHGGAVVTEAAGKIQPDLIVCTGLAAGRTKVTPELVAVNWRMADGPDNAGRSYHGVPIDRRGPAARMTSLPVMKLVEAVQAEEIPCALSLSAGAYVCNDVYWAVLERSESGGCPALFVHVPSMEYVSSQMCAHALETLIAAALPS